MIQSYVDNNSSSLYDTSKSLLNTLKKKKKPFFSLTKAKYKHPNNLINHNSTNDELGKGNRKIKKKKSKLHGKTEFWN